MVIEGNLSRIVLFGCDLQKLDIVKHKRLNSGNVGVNVLELLLLLLYNGNYYNKVLSR